MTVDDSASVRQMVSFTLRNAGYNVVEAVDGPVRVNQCLLRSGNCQLESVCGAHDVWTQIQGRLIQDMEAVTMQELARREMEKGGNNTGQ